MTTMRRDDLTERQREVLALLRRGLTNEGEHNRVKGLEEKGVRLSER
jgi:hypothetical protein